MTNLDLLLAQHEGKTLEFKRDLSSPRAVLRTVVAFSNSAGGVLIVGVEDQTRHVCGVDEPQAAAEKIANMIADGIEPQVAPQIAIRPWQGRSLLAIEVHPGSLKPYRVKTDSTERGVLIRVGSTNRPADRHIIDEMRRHRHGTGYDEEVIPDLGLDALDLATIRETFAEQRPMGNAGLVSLRLLARDGGRHVPTRGGLLLFGFDRERLFPDVWMQCGRFAGVDRQRIIDHCELRDHLTQLPELAFGFIRRQYPQPLEINGFKHRARPTIPDLALREALINAVVHADYACRGAPLRVACFDDRVEIENPGLLPLGLTVDDLREGVSSLRNRVIGRVFKELGLIEQWGSGIQRMLAVCREAGLPEPKFEELANRFRVTLFMWAESAPQLAKMQQAILDALRMGTEGSATVLARELHVSARTIRTHLQRLVELGLVGAVGRNDRDPGRRYIIRREL